MLSAQFFCKPPSTLKNKVYQLRERERDKNLFSSRNQSVHRGLIEVGPGKNHWSGHTGTAKDNSDRGRAGGRGE